MIFEQDNQIILAHDGSYESFKTKEELEIFTYLNRIKVKGASYEPSGDL